MKVSPFPRFFPARTWLVAAALLTVFPGALGAQAPEPRRSLTIAECELSLTLAKVTLVPGPLTPQGDLYTGSYQVRVSPLPLGNESGRLSVRVPEEALRRLERGQTVSFTGEAVNQRGVSRQVAARATPSGPDGGRVHLRITANGRKLVFDTGYQFGGP